MRALLVISAGFAEAGAAGAERQRSCSRSAAHAGMRLIGPNCFGVINNAPSVSLRGHVRGARYRRPATSASSPRAAALGIAMIEAADRLGLGISSFVSVGNKADVSGNDLLEYWEQDPATDVILLYLESFGNPRRFARIARRVGARKADRRRQERPLARGCARDRRRILAR